MSLGRQLSVARQRLADRRGRGVYAGWPDEQRAIFIHVPKTAGTSLAQFLRVGPSRHVPCAVYLDANTRKFASYWKFAFVRNPWDRLVSSFAFLRRGGMNAEDAAFASTHLARFRDFGAFVREGLARPEISSWVHFRPQAHFICDGDGRNRMDFTGRFERIAGDFRVVAERLGLEGDLPVTNRTPRPDYHVYNDAETREIVGAFYRTDIALLGYRFEVDE